MKDKKILYQWLPGVIFAVLTLIFTIVFACTQPNGLFTVYIQLLLGIIAPFAFPILSLFTKQKYPIILSVIIGLLVFFGIHLGKAANLYAYVPNYDKVLHTNFGFVGAAAVYCLLIRWGGENLKPVGTMLLVCLATLGLGAGWELIEYFCSMIVDEDPQLVWGTVDLIVAAGGAHIENPLWDTMQDLLVTIIGSCVFFALFYIDVLCGGKITSKIFK